MIEILNYTTKQPLEMIGHLAGTCWGADTEDTEEEWQ